MLSSTFFLTADRLKINTFLSQIKKKKLRLFEVLRIYNDKKQPNVTVSTSKIHFKAINL